MEGFLRSCRAPEITEIKKAFDQTVRDLKREVNKVLKVPEIEQKVLDATSNEPWGPHGTVMSEIAQATRNYQDYQLIVGVLWRRLGDTGKNWRHVYKALTVMEFIVAHGSEKAVEDLTENVFQIQGLVDFQYEEPNGKDLGINVRKKAETMVALLNDKEKIREAREKAASNKNKYKGICSSGSKHRNSGMGFSDWKDDKYDSKWPSNDKDDRFGAVSNVGKFKESDRYRDDLRGSGLQRDEDHLFSRQTSPPRQKERPNVRDVKQAAATPLTTLDDDDDFNPRATSARPPPPPPPPPAAKVEVDLFGDAEFFSATPAATSSPLEDLLAGQSTQSVPPKPKPASDPFAADLFAFAPSAAVSGDPFAALGTSSSADFGAFSSAPVKSSQHVADPFADPLGAFESGPKTTQSDLDDSSFGAFRSAEDDLTEKQQHQKQEQVANGSSNTFQSSIWSDPLTSELINLNLTAPKTTTLADVGVQLQNSDWSFEDKKPQQAAGKAMGTGSGLGLAGAGILPPPAAAARAGTAPPSYDLFNTVVPSNTATTKTTTQQDPFAAFALS